MIKGWKKLTKGQVQHLKDCNCNHTGAFQRTLNAQATTKVKFPHDVEPCWECWEIAEKLGMSAEEGSR